MMQNYKSGCKFTYSVQYLIFNANNISNMCSMSHQY